ncbi:THAP domain-containing protein, partial [Ooceraea biroi]
NEELGFYSLIVCLKSVLGICEQYIQPSEIKLDYLLTSKMSQDHLELFFSAIRSKGGHNNNPSCRQFEIAFKQLLVHCEIGGSEYANSVPQDTTSFLHAPSTRNRTSIDELSFSIPQESEHQYVKTFDVDEEHNYATASVYMNCSSVYIDNVISYIAGFVVRSIQSKITCNTCSKMLICESTISSLQKIKCRGKLINASQDVIKLCKIAKTSFRYYNVFKNYEKSILQILIHDALRKIPDSLFLNNVHMLQQGILEDLRYQIIKYNTLEIFYITFTS